VEAHSRRAYVTTAAPESNVRVPVTSKPVTVNGRRTSACRRRSRAGSASPGSRRSPAAARGLTFRTRRAELRETLTKVFRANLDDSIRFHLDAGPPGDEVTVVVLYLAMSGLLVDDITVPDVLSAYPDDRLVANLVDHILPPPPE
jgi:hypothetical protein